MDINCPKCGEPWDMDELHYVAEENQTTFTEEVKKFSTAGCQVFDGQPCTEPADRTRALAAAVALELLGDDVDGIAAFMEDMNQ
jgi:hypothetical protein